jgi:hypothetical protein
MRTALCVFALVVLPATPASLQAQDLTEETYPNVRKSILLVSEESHWQKIPWRPNLGVAIDEARKEDKPILLWMMNGHPCGMT